MPLCWGPGADYDGEQEEVYEDAESRDVLAGLSYTPVPAELFAPPKPLSVSGGTAAFYSCRYTGPASGPQKEKYGKTPGYWAGKDVARAVDELPFYEELLRVNPAQYRLLKRWTMDYAGVLTTRPAAGDGSERAAPDADVVRLLMLANLFDGVAASRFLDIKLGEQTAVAHWKGKSAMAAKGNLVIDHLTNSKVEGYRLEGFDSMPESLATRAPSPQEENCVKVVMKQFSKKYKRMNMQRLPARDFLAYMTDFNDLEDQYMADPAGQLGPGEYGEAVLFDVVTQVSQLAVDALNMPAPQMWIGSSLGLRCDSGRLPSRQKALQAVSAPLQPTASPLGRLAYVVVFDWGRSELCTVERYLAMSETDKVQRQLYWTFWLRGVHRCLFEAASYYLSQHCFRQDPSLPVMISFEVWDFDTFEGNDFLGKAWLPLEATNGEVTLDLYDSWDFQRGQLDVSIEELPPPPNSRLQRLWKVWVLGVDGLPRADVFSDTDPLVIAKVGQDVTETSAGRFAVGRTPVVLDDRNAEFMHPLYFGEAKPEVRQAMMQNISSAFGARLGEQHFPEEDDYDRQQQFNNFLKSMPKTQHLAP